jgi:amino acid transporter
MNGVVIGVFMYGGWEASVYLAEEGTDTRRNPGRAGIISVVFCIIWFSVLTMAIEAIAPAKILVANAGNIIAYSAGVIWPKPWSSIVSLAVLSSVIAVTQSQLQNFSRMNFGLSREGLLPRWLGRLSRRHRTPAPALIVAAVIPVAALIIYLANTSAGTTIGLISGTAGLLYIVIYVAGAIACMWYYRRTLLSSARQLIFAGVLPFIGAAALVYAAVVAFPTTPHGTLYPFIVMFVAVFPAAWLVKYLTRAAFFDLPVLAAGDPAPSETADRVQTPALADPAVASGAAEVPDA